MKITTKGQVTIPLEIRERLGLLPNTEVDFRVEGDTVVLTKARKRGKLDSSELQVLRQHSVLRGYLN